MRNYWIWVYDYWEYDYTLCLDQIWKYVFYSENWNHEIQSTYNH